MTIKLFNATRFDQSRDLDQFVEDGYTLVTPCAEGFNVTPTDTYMDIEDKARLCVLKAVRQKVDGILIGGTPATCVAFAKLAEEHNLRCFEVVFQRQGNYHSLDSKFVYDGVREILF